MKVDADGAPEVGERGMYQLRVIDLTGLVNMVRCAILLPE